MNRLYLLNKHFGYCLGVFVTLFFFSCVQAQQLLDHEEIQDFVWGDSDESAHVYDFPNRWSDESAVILYSENTYIYERRGVKTIRSSLIHRKRVKLLDKASVDAFSEFEFEEVSFVRRQGLYENRTISVAGFKVVKGDRSEHIINTDESIQISKKGSRERKKIAIPNLEIGDIVDYYHYSYEAFQTSFNHHFDPVFSILSDDYPILKQKFNFHVEKDFFVNMNTYNGAPDPEETRSTINDKLNCFTLIDENRERYKPLRWFYPKRELAVIKFVVTYIRNNLTEKRAGRFLGDEGSLKRHVTSEELYEYFHDVTFKGLDSRTMKSVKDNLKLGENPRKYARAFYNWYRFYYFNRDTEARVMLDHNVVENAYAIGSSLNVVNFRSAYKFGGILRKEDIKFDFVITVPRAQGSIEDILYTSEVERMLKVYFPEPKYVFFNSAHSTFGTFPPELEGCKSLRFELSDDYKVIDVHEEILPESTHEDNTSRVTLEVQMDLDSQIQTRIDQRNEYAGHFKESRHHEVLTIYDYVFKEYDKFDAPTYAEWLDLNKKAREAFRIKERALKKKILDIQKESLKQSLDEAYSFSVIDLEEYNIEQLGRDKTEENFVINQSFLVEGLINQVGSHYLLNAGELIGGQVDIDKDEIQREHDIYMPFARSYVHEIKIGLPEGYVVKGIEKLNSKVENETGAFVSEAKFVANELLINVQKSYFDNFEKKESWPAMLEFLNAASEFTKQKVLITKAN